MMIVLVLVKTHKKKKNKNKLKQMMLENIGIKYILTHFQLFM